MEIRAYVYKIQNRDSTEFSLNTFLDFSQDTGVLARDPIAPTLFRGRPILVSNINFAFPSGSEQENDPQAHARTYLRASTPAKELLITSHWLNRAEEKPWTNTPLLPQLETTHFDSFTLEPLLASTPDRDGRESP